MNTTVHWTSLGRADSPVARFCRSENAGQTLAQHWVNVGDVGPMLSQRLATVSFGRECLTVCPSAVDVRDKRPRGRIGHSAVKVGLWTQSLISALGGGGGILGADCMPGWQVRWQIQRFALLFII